MTKCFYIHTKFPSTIKHFYLNEEYQRLYETFCYQPMLKTKYFTDAKVACDFQPLCAGVTEIQMPNWYIGFLLCRTPLRTGHSSEHSRTLYIQPGKSYI